MMGRAALRSAILAFALVSGAASAAEFTAKNCMGRPAEVLSYNSTDTVQIVPATWVTIAQSETKTIKCATASCKLVVQAMGGLSLLMSTTYSTDICLVDFAGNPELTSPQAYACQPDRCKP